MLLHLAHSSLPLLPLNVRIYLPSACCWCQIFGNVRQFEQKLVYSWDEGTAEIGDVCIVVLLTCSVTFFFVKSHL